MFRAYQREGHSSNCSHWEVFQTPPSHAQRKYLDLVFCAEFLDIEVACLHECCRASCNIQQVLGSRKGHLSPFSASLDLYRQRRVTIRPKESCTVYQFVSQLPSPEKEQQSRCGKQYSLNNCSSISGNIEIRGKTKS